MSDAAGLAWEIAGMMLVTRAFSRIASFRVGGRVEIFIWFIFFFFLPCPSFFVIAFGFFSFSFLFLSLFSFLFSFRSISIRSVRVFLFLAVSGKDRVMQRMGIVRWFEYLSLHFLFFPLLPFSFRLSIRRETCADVCDREESVVLITF